MLDYLRRHFATTLNEELAGCIGVSQRTMIRKAHELGLRKDAEWLIAIWNERRKEANVVSRQKGYPGGFKKGQHANPDGEFKPGHRLTPEQAARQRDGMRRWYRLHPDEAKAKAEKTLNTRRKGCSEADNPKPCIGTCGADDAARCLK